MYLGLLFVENRVLRGGNEQILNNVKEGIVVVEREGGDVMFANQTARGHGMRIFDDDSLPVLTQGDKPKEGSLGKFDLELQKYA